MHEGIEAREAELVRHLRHAPRLVLGDGGGDGADVLRRGPATAADNIEEAVARPAFEQTGHEFRGLIVLAHLVGKAGIGIDADISAGDVSDLIDAWPELFGAEGAIEPDRERFKMLHRIPEGLGRLAREVASRKI